MYDIIYIDENCQVVVVYSSLLDFSENSQGRNLKTKTTYFLSEVLDMFAV